ncbi:MAG TPA: HepT-like ribonuclease domain-containing protein [Thermoanaerobaculia bacterium]|nr:HepT-like ribonuclease domain-containing protein [Thermoanaerobaculia bacterium]
MENRAKKLLFDALTSGRSIRQWCGGRSFADYEQDRQFRRAVEREFEIIGEALGRLLQADPVVAARIDELHRIISFRNRIIHGYDAIDDAAVWGVAESHLPRLIAEVEALLEEGGESL